MMYKWIDNESGEIRRTIFHVIFGDLQDILWCLRTKRKYWKHNWRYNKKGW